MKTTQFLGRRTLLAAGSSLLLLTSAQNGLGQAFFPILPFDEAELFLEENTTDGDLGLHFKVDGEGWERLILTNWRFHKLLDVAVSGNLGTVIGLTELFSESAEPSFDELPRDAFLDLFPPGIYLFFGRTIDGRWLVGATNLTHHIPGPTTIVLPEEDAVVSADEDLPVQWETLADPNAPHNVIEFYEVVVERDEDEGLPQVFSVIMPATATMVRVPEEFLEPDTEYKVEIVAEETSGNRAASESPFTTGDPGGPDDGEGEDEEGEDEEEEESDE